MREGYWINYKTDKIVEMPEHETWMRDSKNSKMIGVPDNVHVIAANIEDREKYLLFVMQHAPVMRVRGHGHIFAFQFYTHSRQDAMDAILVFCRRNAGPLSWLAIDNFATCENTQMTFEQFEEQMDSGGAEAVLRVAGLTQKVKIKASIVRELLAISKQLIRVRTAKITKTSGYRYQDIGHGPGSIIWWVGNDGKVITFKSTGKEYHHGLNRRMDMDIRWRGRIDLRGTVTMLPPVRIYSRIRDESDIPIPDELIAQLEKLGGKRFLVDTPLRGLAMVAFSEDRPR
jgi:hypothetical protein